MSNQVITKEQMEALKSLKYYFHRHLDYMFEAIQERVDNGKDIHLTDWDYHRLSFLKAGLENLFSVFDTEEE